MGTSKWTAPYLGVQHLESTDRRYRASVTEYSGFADLSLWTPGCGFNPERQQFETAEQARSAGALWLSSINSRQGVAA
ncbi:hypothetical protein [Roseateles sp. PN1]|uniref:hypothetical protein n=1 Tax=Roseateles sp. PN1 TaxID=3137372 RepID=UPI003139BDC6